MTLDSFSTSMPRTSVGILFGEVVESMLRQWQILEIDVFSRKLSHDRGNSQSGVVCCLPARVGAVLPLQDEVHYLYSTTLSHSGSEPAVTANGRR